METLTKNISDIENVKIKTALLDAERLKMPVTFYTRTRRFIDNFTCIDTPNKPLTLENFTVSGGLVYYKINRFVWRTISIDDIDKITLEKVLFKI